MADAVLTQRLLVGASALAGLFLIVLGLVAAFWLLAYMVNHFREANATCEQIIAETVTEPVETPAALDPELDAGRARLLNAVREHREEEQE